MSDGNGLEMSGREEGDESNVFDAPNDETDGDDDDDDSEDEIHYKDDLWGSGDMPQHLVGGSYRNPSSASLPLHSHSDPLSNELGPSSVYYSIAADGQESTSAQQIFISDILNGASRSHLDNPSNAPTQKCSTLASPTKAALIDDFVKASQKMKKKFLTQRFLFDVNARRVSDQLRKRFAKAQPKSSKNGSCVIFNMTMEAAYALRRLLRIERCYQNELVQPMPNRVSQRIKITLFSMRRAFLFLGEVSFPCLGSGDFAFMIPSGSCSNAFDGSPHSIQNLTKGCYSSPQPPVSSAGRLYLIASDASANSLLTVNKDDLVYILDDKHEQSDDGVEDPRSCHWYFAFQPSSVHSGLLLKLHDDRWFPIKARFGWVPSSCINVSSPVTLQYSLVTFKFRLESPRIRIEPDGACFST